jgi:hypothetical protein
MVKINLMVSKEEILIGLSCDIYSTSDRRLVDAHLSLLILSTPAHYLIMEYDSHKIVLGQMVNSLGPRKS